MPAFSFSTEENEWFIAERDINVVLDKWTVCSDCSHIIKEYIGSKKRKGRSIGLTPSKKKKED